MCLVVIVDTQENLRASVVPSSDKTEYNLVSIICVTSYEEGVNISNLYNKMLSIGIKVNNLYKIVNAVRLLKN